MKDQFHRSSSEQPNGLQASDARAREILNLLAAQGFQSIDALSARFGVSTQTIRRDVNALCDKGLCRRRHGGIDVLPEGENMLYVARRVLNQEAKAAIAQAVALTIPDGASLFFGIGTTPEQCAYALLEKPRLRVMTNNLNVAAALVRNPQCEITIAGGRLRNQDNDVIAGEAHQFFSHYHVDIGIFGVGGVADDGSLLDFSLDEVHMRQELAKHCKQRFLVLDHTKFGRAATVRGGHITEVSQVFTDRAVPEPIVHMLSAANVQLNIAIPHPAPSNAPSEGTP